MICDLLLRQKTKQKLHRMLQTFTQKTEGRTRLDVDWKDTAMMSVFLYGVRTVRNFCVQVMSQVFICGIWGTGNTYRRCMCGNDNVVSYCWDWRCMRLRSMSFTGALANHSFWLLVPMISPNVRDAQRRSLRMISGDRWVGHRSSLCILKRKPIAQECKLRKQHGWQD